MIKGIVHHVLLVAVSIISMMLIYSSMLKLVGFPGMEESFLIWGYSKGFMLFIGILEMTLAILIFAKPSRSIGLLGLILLMIGALFTHITNEEYNEIYTALFLIVLSTASFVLMYIEDQINK